MRAAPGAPALALLAAALAGPARAQEPARAPDAAPGPAALAAVALPSLPLGVVAFPGRAALTFAVVLRGGHHGAGDGAGRVWAVSGRGPVVPCAEAPARLGPEAAAPCAAAPGAEIVPLPGYAPTLYGLDIAAAAPPAEPPGGPAPAPAASGPPAPWRARATVTLPLLGRSGRPLSGLPNPASPAPEGGGPARPAPAPFGPDGAALEPDPSGLDPVGVVHLADGGAWLLDRHGPSLVRVGEDGTVLARLVPPGREAALVEADYPVEPLALEREGGAREGAAPPDPAAPDARAGAAWRAAARAPGAWVAGLALGADERRLALVVGAPGGARLLVLERRGEAADPGPEAPGAAWRGRWALAADRALAPGEGEPPPSPAASPSPSSPPPVAGLAALRPPAGAAGGEAPAALALLLLERGPAGPRLRRLDPLADPFGAAPLDGPALLDAPGAPPGPALPRFAEGLAVLSEREAVLLGKGGPGAPAAGGNGAGVPDGARGRAARLTFREPVLK